jgi:uncharacterized membrane protein YkgB
MAKKKSRREEYDDEDDELDEDDVDIEEEDDDDDEDDDERVEEPELPAPVMIASLLWTITGGLILAGFFIGLILYLAQMSEVAAPNQPQQIPEDPVWAAAQVIIAVVIAVFGAVFLIVGIQTLQGSAKDTMGNGIGSIGFGLVYIGFGIFTGLAGKKYAQVLSVVQVLLGFGLAFGGVLALASQKQYVAFAKFRERKKKLKRRKRRR